MSKAITRTALAALLGCALVACESGDDDDGVSTAASEAPSDESAGSGPKMSEPPATADLGQAKQKQGQREMLKKRMEMMKKQQAMKKKAFDAAEQAEAKGKTPCQKAFFAAVAVDTSMREQLGREPTKDDPSKGEFVAKCKELPEKMRECLIPSYARENQQECGEAHKGLDEEGKTKIREIVGIIRGTPPPPPRPTNPHGGGAPGGGAPANPHGGGMGE